MTVTKDCLRDIYKLKKKGAEIEIYIPERYIRFKESMRGYEAVDPRTTVDPFGKPVVYPFAKSGDNWFIICPFCGEVHPHKKLGRKSSLCKTKKIIKGEVVWNRDNKSSPFLWYTIKQPYKFSERRLKDAESNLYANFKVQPYDFLDSRLPYDEERIGKLKEAVHGAEQNGWHLVRPKRRGKEEVKDEDSAQRERSESNGDML